MIKMFTWCFALVPLWCHSQKKFTHHRYEGYAQILSTVQDSIGFLWIGGGTFGKYDGYQIRSYNDGEGNKLYGWPTIDHKGNVCIISFINNQISSYQKETDSFVNAYPDVGNVQISGVAFEPDGKIWIGTIGAGIFLFDPKTKDIQNFTNETPDSANNKRSNLIISIQNYNHYLLLGTSLGLWKFDKTSKTFFRPNIQLEESLLLYQQPVRKIFSHVDHFWFYLPDRIVKSDLDLKILQEFIVPDDIDRSSINQFSIDQDGSGVFWIATYGQGLLSFDPNNSKVNRYRHDPTDKYSIASDVLQTVAVDREQNIWIGTFSHGFDQLKKQSIQFHEAYLPGRVTPTAPCVISNAEGDFLLQESKSNGFWIASLSDLESIQFQSSKTEPTMEVVTSSNSALGKDSWWIGTWNHGIFGIPLDVKTRLPLGRKTVHYLADPKNPNTIPENSGGVWLEDNNGDLWVTSPQNTLHRINRSVPYGAPGSLTSFVPNEQDSTSISKGNIWGVINAHQAGILVLTSFALDVFDGKVFKTIYRLENEKAEFFCLTISPSGDIFIGGMTGLIIGKKNNRGYIFESVEQLKGVTIFSIEVDKESRIWAAGENGLFCYDRNRDLVFQFKEEDGLSSNEFIANASTQTPDGILIFSNANGLTLFDPSSLELSIIKPTPILTQLRVNNRAVKIKSERAVDNNNFFSIPTHISVLSELELDHNHAIFSIEFAALELVSPEKNLYQYQLEGFDKDWIQTDWTDRTAHYTNLNAGKYTLKVRATNHDGIWSDHVTTLSIRILPPPWKTWWAYTGYFILAAGALVLARRNIIQRERLKSNLQLEHIKLEKAKEIDRVKTSFFTNISHEFRTPLTLIKGPVQNILNSYKNDTKLQEQLKLVLRNSDLLLKLINQLLDLAKLEAGTLHVEASEGNLNSFISTTCNSLSSLAYSKNIHFEVTLPPTDFQALFDKDKLETILINLANNAIKFTQAQGAVHIRADVTDGQLILTVRDTGIGIPEEHQSKIFERFHQVSEAHKEVGTGIGLALVKELVQLMNGSIELKSKVGEGSVFSVVLPIEIVGSQAIRNETKEIEPQVQTANEFKSSQTSQSSQTIETTQERQDSVGFDTSTKPHVLVVEDNADLRAFIIDSLGNEFHFLEAADGKQGLETALEKVPNLIVSDVMMPEMDGITMAGKLKSDVRTSHIPILILTAKSTEDSKLSGLQKGADDYLTKPFNKQELLLKVRNGVMSRIKLREKIRLELMKEAPRIEVASADEQFLMKVKEAIHNRLSDEQLSVESVADEIGLSRAQLYRKVTALTGVSVNELIRSFRLKKAAQLLEQNWGPVSQVAYEVGFSNLSYFSKVFKEEYGVLPSEYSHKN